MKLIPMILACIALLPTYASLSSAQEKKAETHKAVIEETKLSWDQLSPEEQQRFLKQMELDLKKNGAMGDDVYWEKLKYKMMSTRGFNWNCPAHVGGAQNCEAKAHERLSKLGCTVGLPSDKIHCDGTVQIDAQKHRFLSCQIHSSNCMHQVRLTTHRGDNFSQKISSASQRCFHTQEPTQDDLLGALCIPKERKHFTKRLDEKPGDTPK